MRVLLLLALALPMAARAALVYEPGGILDTLTGLRWRSTLASAGAPGPALPADRAFGGGYRVATSEEVIGLFTGNFPELATLMTSLLPAPPQPEVNRLLDALGASASQDEVQIYGQVHTFASYSVRGWFAARDFSQRLEDLEPRWAYRRMGIGYGTAIQCDGTSCGQPFPVFSGHAPVAGGFTTLSAAEAAPDGYFLVAAVPLPAGGWLLLSGLLALAAVRRRPRIGA